MDFDKKFPEEKPEEKSGARQSSEAPSATGIFSLDQFGPPAPAAPTPAAASAQAPSPITPPPSGTPPTAGSSEPPPAPSAGATGVFSLDQFGLAPSAPAPPTTQRPETAPLTAPMPPAKPDFMTPEPRHEPSPPGATGIFGVDMFGPSLEPAGQSGLPGATAPSPLGPTPTSPAPGTTPSLSLDQFGPVPTAGTPLGAPHVEAPPYAASLPPPPVPRPVTAPPTPAALERPFLWVLLGAGAVAMLALIVGVFWIYLGRMREAARTSEQVPPSGLTGSVTGRVANQAGDPMANVKISVRNQISGQVHETLTDWNGTYTAANLPPGQYELSAEAPPGFEARKIPGLTLAEKQELKSDLQLILTNPAELSGRVADDQGRPLREFRVRATDRATQREVAVAGSRGNYQITGLAPGGYDVTLETPRGYKAESKTSIDLRPGQTTSLDLVAARELLPRVVTTGIIRGRVVDEQGIGLAGATVRVAEPTRRFARTVATDARGQFRFPDLPAGTYALEAAPPAGYSPKSVSGVKLTVGQEQEVNFPVQKVVAAAPPPPPAHAAATGSISGTVADSRGKALGGIPVKLIQSASGEVLKTLTTDAKGGFAANGLPSGTYDVSVEPASTYPSKRVTGLKLAAGQHLSASVSLPEPGARFRVSHKHAFGSCAGVLTVGGGRVQYAAEKGDHSFDFPASEVAEVKPTGPDGFSIRLEGGKRYEFKSDSASEVLNALERAIGRP